MMNKPGHTPVETHGPGSLLWYILEFFVDLDFQQAWMTPVEKLKFVSPFGTFKKKKINPF